MFDVGPIETPTLDDTGYLASVAASWPDRPGREVARVGDRYDPA